MIDVRSVLAATDLSVDDDPVVRSAATLARAFNAALHVIHVGPPWDDRERPRLTAELHEQLQRTLGSEADAAGAVLFDRPFHGILVHAAAVHADLIVMGSHRGTERSARWVGTTAERVVRSADVPCLVVNRPLTLPVRHVGVPVDFSPEARGGAFLAGAWAPNLHAPGSSLRLSLIHVALPGRTDTAIHLASEVDQVTARAPHTDVHGVSVDDTDVVRAVVDWTEREAPDLLVLPAETHRGLRRVWTGNPSTDMAVRVDVPVLLIPPALWRRSPVPLVRVVTAEDRSNGCTTAHDWIHTHLSGVRSPLSVASVSPKADLIAEARRREADLLVVPVSASEPSPVQVVHLLENTPIPVLLLRERPKGPVKHILVAVDTGDIWYEKLGWARLLADHFDADVTVFHAVDLSVQSRVRREPGGEFVPAFSAWTDDVERTVVPAMRTWLTERVRMAGLSEDRVNVQVGLQDPWYAIPPLAEHVNADLVIVAAHPEARAGRVPIRKLTRSVLEGGPYSVLAVIDRARRLADRNLRRTSAESVSLPAAS